MPRIRPGGRPGVIAVLGAAIALSATATAEYTVRAGDTLTWIARQHGTSVDDLSQRNDLADPDRILAGQRLRVGDTQGGDGATTSSPGPSRAEAGALIERVATEHGWSPAFVKALAWQESGWQSDAVSHVGAVGIMQVMPGTGRFVSRNLAGRELDLDDPEDNVLAGVLFLDYLHGLTGGDPERTLAGYYQGLASVARYGMFDDTRRYIDNVLVLRERFR